MKPSAGLPADLMALLVWTTVFIAGISLVANCGLSVFNWLLGSR